MTAAKKKTGAEGTVADAAAAVAQADVQNLTQGGDGDGPADQDGDDDTQADAAAAAGPAAATADAGPAADPSAQAAVTAVDPAAARLAELISVIVPEANQRKEAVAIGLLLECCERYNVDPRAKKTPIELLAWRFYPGNDLASPPVPDAVVIVTGGGVKIKHFEDPSYPMDVDTEERLAKVFNAYNVDPKTKTVTRKPLPANLALPVSAVTGEIVNVQHVHAGGYLRRQGDGGTDPAKAQRTAERLRKLGIK